MSPILLPALRRLVVAIDFTEQSMLAARWAAESLAARLELVLVHVVQPPPVSRQGEKRYPSTERLMENALIGAESRLRELAASITTAGRVRTEVRGGEPHEEIIRVAVAYEADVVVVARSNAPAGGWGRLGTTAQRVLRGSPVPVLLAAGLPRTTPSTLLAAVDDSNMTGPVLEWTGFLQSHFAAETTVLHVVSVPLFVGSSALPGGLRGAGDVSGEKESSVNDHATTGAEGWLRKELAHSRLREDTMQAVIAEHIAPAAAIVSEAHRRDTELLIMGSRGFGATHRFLFGSTAEGVLRHSPCPVLVVVPLSRAADARAGVALSSMGLPTVEVAAGRDAADDLDPVDEASNESFPASDTPPWGPMRLGPPRE